MTIEEAIEILETLCGACCHPSSLREKDALNLGIEALKTWKLVRAGAWPNTGYLLPSETEEQYRGIRRHK